MEDIEFIKYLVNCPICGKYETTGFFETDTYPINCELDSSHTLNVSNLTNILSYEGFTQKPQKGSQVLTQFQNQHNNRNDICNFRPIIIKPDMGCILEVIRIDVIWHEDLIAKSKVVWEIQISNPAFDLNLPESNTNPTHLILAQFYYADFSELWGGSIERPVSDGPTRQMSHIFSDRNSANNRTPFLMYSSQGMRIYAYSSDDSKHIEGEGTQFNTINGTKFYIPYTENTLDINGLYSNIKSASYPLGYDKTTIKECDDVYTFNALGSQFLEV